MTDRTVPTSVLESWATRCASAPDRVAVSYFDQEFTVTESDRLADGIASALEADGVGPGDLVGIALQNVPQFVWSILALWKLRASVLLINPMYQDAELDHLLEDSGAVGVIADFDSTPHLRRSCERRGIKWWHTSVTVLAQQEGATDPEDLLTRARDGKARRTNRALPTPDSCALLTYTSGTTGPPKGAINTHAGVVTAATSFARIAVVDDTDVVLAMAPMFHITGAVINAMLAITTGAQLVMIGRFDPETAIGEIRRREVSFSVAAITAYLALANQPTASPADFRTIRAFYSGGAPVSPATAERLEAATGHYIHNVYGMTETTSAVIAVPLGSRAPVDPMTGVLSVGKAMDSVDAHVIDDQHQRLAPGVQGELVLSGPSVVPGYWKNADATEGAFVDGALRTGDGAVIDRHGWVFLVDRLKDQINTSGYKVWPREVEEVLLAFDGVREAAVVGAPDDYRGERVVAYVVADPGATPTDAQMQAFARERLAAYKVPREIHTVASLPTTASGKVQRRRLRSSSVWDLSPTTPRNTI
ncbi:class I adenylate-forming enzyme family protein [Rhodococcus wratislaviensis]|uniref:Putative fatty-acid--CoA ligase n=1 Tax=Rhodococcus wratislaviensis NBRC 100605 TaxID=1219028 RepID=X0QD89_RHOWR|nr:AMP-binding protein [Rhodococcus wratislaviensis]GAF49527.1 putative fatty-acid--CoA ligase [Rhodococcus wratislaviensis NBRC 100605]